MIEPASFALAALESTSASDPRMSTHQRNIAPLCYNLATHATSSTSASPKRIQGANNGSMAERRKRRDLVAASL